jgi:tripartite-type tricarboxylate transporter receptor subunit TctC
MFFRSHAAVRSWPLRSLALACIGAVLSFSSALPASAQGKYPDKPVRIVLPFGAGGVADVTARLVAEKLSEKLGQRFVIENMPGAGGITAARAVLQSPADGYTLALLSNGTAVSVGLFKSLPFDPVKDFAPVSSMGYFDLIFVTGANSPYKTLGDFIKAAKASPGKLNLGTIAVGSTQNLGAELFKTSAGIDIFIVPHKTSAEVLLGVERNDVQLGAEFYAAARGPLSGKKLVALGTSGPKPAPYLPGVPTVASVVPGFDVTSWNAIFAPAGTPADVIATLNKALNEVLADPEIKKKALDLGIVAQGSTPAEIQKRLQDDIVKWSKVINDAKIQKQ